MEKKMNLIECWAICYNEDGDKVKVSGLFPSYDEFYKYLDEFYGYDVLDDGDN